MSLHISNHPLLSISPIDGRYRNATKPLENFYSESALFKYRVFVEIEYFIALCQLPLPQLKGIDKKKFRELRSISTKFSLRDAEKIKETESKINHDVKAVEYFIKEKFDTLGIAQYKEFVHFGLTSQDINNTAIPLQIKNSLTEVFYPLMNGLVEKLNEQAKIWGDIPMLAHTHGQPASPTRVGKELKVFSERLKVQLSQLRTIPFSAKFGGATGNLNAHHVAYPDIDWNKFANRFVTDTLKLQRSWPTTQIEHYDNMAAMCDCMKRFNTILIDLCRDMWMYISMNYFKQRVNKYEVGSSAMPHKVNPIDFENAEGNLGFANAVFEHLSAKLPVSRLQRDLTDSTVLRNTGVPFAHSLIAYSAILKGLNKIVLNEEALKADLENNWTIIAEAVQTILRREGYPKPYEVLKSLTRTDGGSITRETIHRFIDSLKINTVVKKELKKITPFNYVGI